MLTWSLCGSGSSLDVMMKNNKWKDGVGDVYYKSTTGESENPINHSQLDELRKGEGALASYVFLPRKLYCHQWAWKSIIQSPFANEFLTSGPTSSHKLNVESN